MPKMDLNDVIREDCNYFEKRFLNVFSECFYFHYYEAAKMGALIYNGEQIFFGSPEECNAAVKTMIRFLEVRDAS